MKRDKDTRPDLTALGWGPQTDASSKDRKSLQEQAAQLAAATRAAVDAYRAGGAYPAAPGPDAAAEEAAAAEAAPLSTNAKIAIGVGVGVVVLGTFGAVLVGVVVATRGGGK